ncbi:hypothetical protein H257_17442 [Aphanomyces astaci]|uniref:Uncharacterized protein n=1 Tax=Aphanomyces astaci TaxID=112090 RepID=W4FGH1_APHAT|nr:hypothetical protein H257_17442 [Aphanomyces astaci]ETV65964.1 hypothetical protein H257_17442 [Aphanomyces astaci]|eukprot:XP_009844543.1 hypothetical protein H257_17442 [Aphanomyces astaci]
MDLALCPGDHTPSRLSGVKPTRSLTKGDITTFDTTDWLEASVQNLYDILYTSAKIQWGETSHIRKALNRAVAIQRTNRGRISNLRLAHMVELPKWIRIPNLPPSTCWHSFGAIAIGHRTLEKCMSQKARLAYHLHPTNPRAPTNRMVPRPPNAEIPPISTRSTHSTHSIQSVIIRPADVLPRYSSDQEEIHSDRLQGPTLSVTASSMIWIAQTSVVAQAFQTPAGTTWDTTYHYDADMQARCDRSLHTRVSPGYGGVSQELWISASACIRERERTVINLILRTCLVPPILEHKQMIYLAKSAIARGVVNLDLGLPPWRPIIVQTALNSWVMEYIYRKLGVPSLPRQLMDHFLEASQIDIRTVFGWLDGGIRTQTRTISSLLFVDDALDISTSYSVIQDRAKISNYFTGQSASGGVFGADKLFLFYLSPHAYPAITLNDGLGNPQPIRVVAPSEAFGTWAYHNQWEKTTRTVWLKLNTQAPAIAPRGLGKRELQYINAVWIPSVLFRTAISDTINIAPALDTLFRKTTRRVLRLPHDHPNSWFYAHTYGLGIVHCERFSHSQRLYQFLRIANDRGSPAHEILMESLEAYQIESGLTDHPLVFRIPPPASDTAFLGTLLRDLATFKPALTITTQRHHPPLAVPTIPTTALSGLTSPQPTALPSSPSTALTPTKPDTLSYRIGRRISLQTRHTPAGPEIAVTSWHELRKGSDIWYSSTSREAPSRLRLVPSAGCAILTGDLLRTSRIQRLKPSSHTTNNLPHIPHLYVLLATASRTLPSVWTAGNGTILSVFGTPGYSTPLHPTYGLHTLPLRGALTHSVGDGSVTHQDTRTAHGTWSYLGRDDTTLVEPINVHPDHITPTCCEVHSLWGCIAPNLR